MATFYSNQTSPQKDLNDMREALRIVANRMKRTPPQRRPNRLSTRKDRSPTGNSR
jgi:hypothetical protein